MRYILSIAALFVLLPAAALADVKYYRFGVDTWGPGPPMYTGRVQSRTAPGKIYEVETDMRGRLVRVATLRDGAKLEETIFEFTGTRKYADGYRYYQNGAFTSRTRFRRDATEQVIYADARTTKGELTGYYTCSYQSYEADCSIYTADGKLTGRSQTHYTHGLIDTTRGYRNSDDRIYFETTYDQSTGLPKSEVRYEKGQRSTESRFTYDNNGEMIRMDHYMPTGQRFGTVSFSDGLERISEFESTDGMIKEQFTYDNKRLAQSVAFYHNSRLICTFTYDRFSNGMIKRTLANGPDGAVWAEYPNDFVEGVNRDGTPIDHTSTPKIYHAGNWW